MTDNRFIRLMLSMVFLSCCACDGPAQTVAVTAEDYRFVPDIVRVKAGTSFTLTLYNAGREDHEFVSPILAYGTGSERADTPDASALGLLKPGRSLRLLVAAPPGTYLYSCRRKGHPNMTGTLIVE